MSPPEVTITVDENLASDGLRSEKEPKDSPTAVPRRTAPKMKRKVVDAPWQTHAVVTPETTGYSLRKRKSPKVVEFARASACEPPRKRVQRNIAHAKATGAKRDGPIAEASSTEVRKLQSKSPCKSRKGKERVSASPTPLVTSLEIHDQNVLVDLSGNFYEDEWDSEATLDDGETHVKVNEQMIDSDVSSVSYFTEEEIVAVPTAGLLLEDKPVDICACGRILDEERQKPSDSMSQQQEPRRFLLGGFTDAKFQQALKDKLEQTVPDSPQDALLMWRRHVAVTEYAQQFHEQIFAVTKIGENIRDLYHTMDNECDNCQRDSRDQIQHWEQKRDMIFDHGPSALGMHGIGMSGAVGHTSQVHEFWRAEARDRRQKEEAQYGEL
ncbi:hypothetical protein L211DRAFT_890826 [Terfezia boudieri ATCC MYA-4762]|uniref:Uncharacterized protein n=1 Tax=Terfezia boudieri ATCC MYA-4762 TaxID=1051890 RepID=A0A3N4LXZ5_9PEZI|nr:hypothetical protein L211DRAFT_890826 [Terfezia boudieri ATCC MYA-4762]